MRPLYEHTQVGWATRLAAAVGVVVLLAMSAQAGSNGTALLVAAVLLPIVILVFSRLTVRIERDRLTVAFGFGWPRRTVAVADIAAAEITRTTWIEGWGIRLTRRGWLWNVSGLDAVSLQLSTGKRLMIGTDEPRKLHAAIERARAGAMQPERRR
jgi:hypothetical protein